MVKLTGIITLVLVIVILLTTGCTIPNMPLSSFEHTTLSCEVKNMTLLSPLGGVYTLDIDDPGKYDITVRTMFRSKSRVESGYWYVTNDPILDRFGSKDNLVYHKWDRGINNHLGYTNNNHVLESSFEIPNESIEQKLVFVVYDENIPTAISLRKSNCFQTEVANNR
jgi:hypothetical protein